MPLERSLPAGAIFAPSDVTQSQFEAKTKGPDVSVTDTVIILNPFAGNLETVRDWQERVESIVGSWPIRITAHHGEAEALARQAAAQGFRRVIAAGGDGTVNQVANGIAGSTAALGILPMGTVNVFAMELGLPSNDLEQCWEIVRAGNMRVVDLPSANGKYFVQLGGIGLDAQAVKETTLAFKRSLGPLSYLISAVHIAARQPPKLFIESHDAPVREGSFVLVGNGRLYGGPFPFFKQAIIDDGLLDVIVFKRLGFLEIIKYLHDVVFSSDIRVPEIEYFQTRQLRVSSEQDVPVELDGELSGNCPVDFQMHPQALAVLAPPASP
jgi:YegS/Rv2252/BmrU family lipid kinase